MLAGGAGLRRGLAGGAQRARLRHRRLAAGDGRCAGGAHEAHPHRRRGHAPAFAPPAAHGRGPGAGRRDQQRPLRPRASARATTRWSSRPTASTSRSATGAGRRRWTSSCAPGRDGRIEHEGKYWTIPETELFPKPVQRPHPPVFLMVTQSDDSVLFAAKRLFPIIMGQGPDWDDAKHKVELYRETALAGGPRGRGHRARDGAVRRSSSRCTSPAVDAAGARRVREGADVVLRTSANRGMFGFNKEPQPYDYYLHHRSVILGTPEAVADQIAEYTRVHRRQQHRLLVQLRRSAARAGTALDGAVRPQGDAALQVTEEKVDR